jgi:Lrp/AsnC family leucine-responsive transcriptional regulator
MKLDQIDLKILTRLQEEGRITNAQLSQEIGLSPAPTLERVKKLEANGYLTSYHGVVNPLLLGYPILSFIEITLSGRAEKDYKEFEKAIQNIPQIMECYHVADHIDFLLKVVATDLKSLESTIVRKLGNISLVSTLKTKVVLSTTKHSYVLNLEGNPE